MVIDENNDDAEAIRILAGMDWMLAVEDDKEGKGDIENIIN